MWQCRRNYFLRAQIKSLITNDGDFLHSLPGIWSDQWGKKSVPSYWCSDPLITCQFCFWGGRFKVTIKIVCKPWEEGWEDKKTNASRQGWQSFCKPACKKTHFGLGCFELDTSPAATQDKWAFRIVVNRKHGSQESGPEWGWGITPLSNQVPNEHSVCFPSLQDLAHTMPHRDLMHLPLCKSRPSLFSHKGLRLSSGRWKNTWVVLSAIHRDGEWFTARDKEWRYWERKLMSHVKHSSTVSHGADCKVQQHLSHGADCKVQQHLSHGADCKV